MTRTKIGLDRNPTLMISLIALISLLAAAGMVALVEAEGAHQSPIHQSPIPSPTPPSSGWGCFYDCWSSCVWLEGDAFEDCGEGCADRAGIDPWTMTTGTPVVVPGRTPVVCYPLYARYPVRCGELIRRGDVYYEANWWNIWWETPEPTLVPSTPVPPTPEPEESSITWLNTGELWMGEYDLWVGSNGDFCLPALHPCEEGK